MAREVKFCTMFGGEGSEAQNAVWTAIEQCGIDMAEGHCEEIIPGDSNLTYNWLEDTPRASLVCELVDKLKELGYQITKI